MKKDKVLCRWSIGVDYFFCPSKNKIFSARRNSLPSFNRFSDGDTIYKAEKKRKLMRFARIVAKQKEYPHRLRVYSTYYEADFIGCEDWSPSYDDKVAVSLRSAKSFYDERRFDVCLEESKRYAEMAVLKEWE